MSAASALLRSVRRGFCTAVVVAAGTSERMGEDKLFLELRSGMPVLAMTLSALNGCASVDEIIVVTREESIEKVGALRGRFVISKLTKIVFGGATRTESALAGVTAADRRAKLICIHDGDRPFVTDSVIAEAVELAAVYGAAAPAVPLRDTVKTVENGVVTATPDRASLRAVQTPQVFRAELIKAALTKAARENLSYTDDCAAVEALGAAVHLSAGDEDNIKLTTPADLALARAILERRSGAAT